MAGDWIKMRTDLFTHPKVFKISQLLGKDELFAVGALFAFWAWVDKHAVDGRVDGATSQLVDRATRVEGLSDALISVEWMVISDRGISIPEFGEHNGDSAKERVLKNQRQARWRARKADGLVVDESASTDASTREDKRREEVKEPPNPPLGAEKPSKRKAKVALKTFLAGCKANGVKPVSSYKPVMEYVEKVGLPVEFLELAWDVFRREHTDGGANERRLQADWQQHFCNYVTKGYMRLWVCKPDGSFELTTVGLQARKFLEAA